MRGHSNLIFKIFENDCSTLLFVPFTIRSSILVHVAHLFHNPIYLRLAWFCSNDSKYIFRYALNPSKCGLFWFSLWILKSVVIIHVSIGIVNNHLSLFTWRAVRNSGTCLNFTLALGAFLEPHLQKSWASEHFRKWL